MSRCTTPSVSLLGCFTGTDLGPWVLTLVSLGGPSEFSLRDSTFLLGPNGPRLPRHSSVPGMSPFSLRPLSLLLHLSLLHSYHGTRSPTPSKVFGLFDAVVGTNVSVVGSLYRNLKTGDPAGYCTSKGGETNTTQQRLVVLELRVYKHGTD